jgi:hypothetical protein
MKISTDLITHIFKIELRVGVRVEIRVKLKKEGSFHGRLNVLVT